MTSTTVITKQFFVDKNGEEHLVLFPFKDHLQLGNADDLRPAYVIDYHGDRRLVVSFMGQLLVESKEKIKGDGENESVLRTDNQILLEQMELHNEAKNDLYNAIRILLEKED